MSEWAWLVPAALIVAGAWIYQARSRPRYLVTLQKRTSDQTNEVVTIQGNFPASITKGQLWEEIEGLATAAVNRMQTVNEQIMEVNKQIEDEIMRRRVERLPIIVGEVEERRNRRIAKELQMKPQDVLAVLQRYRWRGLQNLADTAEAEEAS